VVRVVLVGVSASAVPASAAGVLWTDIQETQLNAVCSLLEAALSFIWFDLFLF
jgi:hypothetical protein